MIYFGKLFLFFNFPRPNFPWPNLHTVSPFLPMVSFKKKQKNSEPFSPSGNSVLYAYLSATHLLILFITKWPRPGRAAPRGHQDSSKPSGTSIAGMVHMWTFCQCQKLTGISLESNSGPFQDLDFVFVSPRRHWPLSRLLLMASRNCWLDFHHALVVIFQYGRHLIKKRKFIETKFNSNGKKTFLM